MRRVTLRSSRWLSKYGRTSMGILGAIGPIGETPPGWVLPGAVVDLDFANNRYFGRSLEHLVTSRASVGYAPYSAQGNNGLLGIFAANVPRITDLGLLSELPATNLALRSRDFANAAWTAVNITVAQTSNGADGTANGAARLTAGAANGTLLQVVTGSAVARVVSFYIKRITGSGAVGICQDGVTFTDISAQLNSTGFTLVSLAATQLNPSFGIRLSTSGDAVDVDFAQLETGPIATSPIVTAGATATRNADVCTMTVQPAVSYGALYAQIRTVNDHATVEAFLELSNVAGTDNVTLRRSSAASLQGRIKITGVATNANDGVVSDNAVSKVMISWSPGSIRDLSNGGTVSSGAPGTLTAGPNVLFLGCDDINAEQARGWVMRAAMFRSNVPDQLMQAMTA